METGIVSDTFLDFLYFFFWHFSPDFLEIFGASYTPWGRSLQSIGDCGRNPPDIYQVFTS
jgi:hypothetical protein